MKFIKLYLACIGILTGAFVFGQFTNTISALQPEAMTSAQNPPGAKGFCSKICSKMKTTFAVGFANYYGDLTENAHWLNQSGFAISTGVSYPIIPRLNVRVDMSVMKVSAKDSKNKRVDLQARNLSFKTVIWDLSTAVEIDMFNLNKVKFTPYAFVGFGVFYFNPFTKDANGDKQFLRYLGTEGQGLAAYPDRKLYKRVEAEIPFGGGFKWACKKNVTVQLEFKYRKTNTDYIDDVSRLSYPNKALLDARNPRSATLTWRGNEVGTGPYPTNPNLKRGNPGKNDVFYTTQFKVMLKL